MERINVLWADDEIDLLKPHILFLKDKGYDVHSAASGDEALELAEKNDYSVVLLDENMPGLSGLETLNRLKAKYSDLPVIMITKSEEEHLMEDAIGSKISDYLIKPVNPNQILLSLKKTLDNKRLISEKTTSNYQQEFRQIGMTMGDRLGWAEWQEVYKKLVYWELELEKSKDESMFEILKMQKSEANKLYGKFVENNYIGFLNGKIANPPMFSHTIFKQRIAPMLEGPETTSITCVMTSGK
jgi:DNA-binding response OmpR family regulator